MTAPALGLALNLFDPRPRCGRTGKVMFASRAEAGMACRNMPTRGGKPPAPYRCGWCEGWHAGNPRGSGSKARAR